MFHDLRQRLFTEPVLPGPDRGAELHGVAMEARVTNGSFLVFGLLDGSASVYLSSGGGWLGGQGKPHVNCLLTTLARGDGRPATITVGAPPPHPAGLTNDVEDQKWIAGIGFDLAALDSGEVAGILLAMAGFRWYWFGKSEGLIEVKVATPCRRLIPVAFRVRRRRDGGRTQVEVAADRASA